MQVKYTNMPVGMSKFKFILSLYHNKFRTWWKFHYNYPWVKYDGFIRVMPGTSFAKFDIKIGNRVQFGLNCNVSANVHFGNNILMASNVSFVGRKDHGFEIPGQFIWDTEGDRKGITIIEDDVWLGDSVIICGPLKIGRGSIVAAGAVVTKDIPECEIWGGVPARKISDRFKTAEEKRIHLGFLDSQSFLNK